DEYGVPWVTEDMMEYSYRYSGLYKGEIDFSQWDHFGPKVTLNLIEGGVLKALKAHEATEYEIPFDSDAVLVQMDGIYLRMKHNFVSQASPTGGDHLVGMIQTTSEGKAPNLAVFSVYQKQYQSPDF